MVEPLSPAEVNDILFPKVDISRIRPISAEEAKRVMNELAAEYRKTHPDAPTEITGTFDAYTDE